MGKFNYKKWVIDHKYSKKPSLIKEDDETVAGVTLPSTKSETQLIKFLRQLIIDIQDGKYSKDASPSEIDNLVDLIILVLNAMADGNITSIIQRLGGALMGLSLDAKDFAKDRITLSAVFRSISSSLICPTT